MKTRQSRRQTAKVSHSRWVAYATAGAATALVGSNSAEAAIHYSGLVVEKFPPHSNKIKSFQLDQPGDHFVLSHFAQTFWGEAGFRMNGIASAGFRGYISYSSSSSINVASKLHFGQRISAGSFISAPSGYISARMVSLYSHGPWADPGMGFIGFKFNSGAGIQYGWARVRIANSKFNGLKPFKLLDYAYADPGEAIGAGQGIPRAGEDGQDMSDEQGPDEGSLGWLAVGAVGLLAWRKRRSRTARLEDA